MYLLELIFENSAYSGDGGFRFRKRQNGRTIYKWTRLGEDKGGRELLTLITIGLGGEKYLNSVPVPADVVGDPNRPLRVAHLLARHYPHDIQTRDIPFLGSGVRVDADGHVAPLRSRELTLLPPHFLAHKLRIGTRISAYFLLAYGPGFRPGPKGEDFNFTDPLFRRKRFHSILMRDAPLTNPADFIARLQTSGDSILIISLFGLIPAFRGLNSLPSKCSRWNTNDISFPSTNGNFSQSRRQSAGSLVRRTVVRLRVIP